MPIEPTSEALAAAHALTCAISYRADDELVRQLLEEAQQAADGGLGIALGAAHVSLRVALDMAEARMPGFRAEFLTMVGRAWADTT